MFSSPTDTGVYKLWSMEKDLKTWVWCLQWLGNHEALVSVISHQSLITRCQEVNSAILPPDGNDGRGTQPDQCLVRQSGSGEKTIAISHPPC